MCWLQGNVRNGMFWSAGDCFFFCDVRNENIQNVLFWEQMSKDDPGRYKTHLDLQLKGPFFKSLFHDTLLVTGCSLLTACRSLKLFNLAFYDMIQDVPFRTYCAYTCLCVSVPPRYKVQSIPLTCRSTVYIWRLSKNFPFSKQCIMYSMALPIMNCTEVSALCLSSSVLLQFVCSPSAVPQFTVTNGLSSNWISMRCFLLLKHFNNINTIINA